MLTVNKVNRRWSDNTLDQKKKDKQWVTTRKTKNRATRTPLTTNLYDKRADLNFPIGNFPFICSNIPAAPAYGEHISQLIRYSRTFDSYQDFLDRGLLLRRNLKLNQGFLLVKLNSSLRKFYCRHRYKIFVSQMTMDMFHLS